MDFFMVIFHGIYPRVNNVASSEISSKCHFIAGNIIELNGGFSSTPGFITGG